MTTRDLDKFFKKASKVIDNYEGKLKILDYDYFIISNVIFTSDKDYYYQYKEQSWKEKIQEDIERIIPKCNTVDEFLDELSIIGYGIKRGKNISVRCIGMERSARISTIDERLRCGSKT